MKKQGQPLPVFDCRSCGWFWPLWGVCGNPDSKLCGEYVGLCDTCSKWKNKASDEVRKNIELRSIEECKKFM